MEKIIKKIIRDSITTKALLLYDENIIKKIRACADIITKTLKNGGKVLIFGNGGSAADSQHFAAELVGRFQKERKALAAITLTTDTSILTSLSNDYSFDIVFARQIEAYAGPRDLAFAISTSGNAKNVIRGVKEAKKLKIKTIGLTGKNGGELAKIADLSIVIPSFVTARIQESHILIIHIICELVEESWTKK
ncbi:MAG: D-sedoheptulose 7-phosphate isomerase [Candidatus Omnitrophota bacterium]